MGAPLSGSRGRGGPCPLTCRICGETPIERRDWVSVEARAYMCSRCLIPGRFASSTGPDSGGPKRAENRFAKSSGFKTINRARASGRPPLPQAHRRLTERERKRRLRAKVKVMPQPIEETMWP
jgi:hypothetical protein